MKKRILCMMLAALMVLGLTACGECKHEWGEATCTTASTCSKCGETQGEALGHSWQEASCSAPETCINCGETQGEALPHSYGSWEINGEEMSRSCAVCGESETQPLDYDVAIKSMLSGRWEFYYLISGQKSTETYSGDPSCYFEFDENGKGIQYFPLYEDSSEVTVVEEIVYDDVAFSQFDTEDGTYLFMMRTEDGEFVPAAIEADEYGRLHMAVSMDDDFLVEVTKNPEETEALAGCWTAVGGGRLNVLRLSEDGTLTGDVNGEIEGTWHSMASILSNGTWYTGFNIIYTRDGVYHSSGSIIWLCSEDTDPMEALANGYSASNISLLMEEEYYPFDRVSEEQYEALVKAHGESAELLAGTWSCDKVSIHNINSSESTEESGDFSVTFNPDGSFTTQFATPLEGSWSYRGVEVNGNDINALFDVVMGDEDTYIRISADGEALFSFNADDGNYYSYVLSRDA